MRRLIQTISWCAIVATILPSMLYLVKVMDLETCQWIMLLGTIAWFVATPLWMGRPPSEQDQDTPATAP